MYYTIHSQIYTVKYIQQNIINKHTTILSCYVYIHIIRFGTMKSNEIQGNPMKSTEYIF